MKKYYLCFLFLILLKPYNLLAQFTLTVEINDLRNSCGQILLHVYDQNQNKVKGEYGVIKDNKCIIIIENLKASKYAFKYFHDENKNEKLDTNLFGLPTEGYGFSNNAEGTFGPPPFEKWIFDFNEDKKMICTPNY